MLSKLLYILINGKIIIKGSNFKKLKIEIKH